MTTIREANVRSLRNLVILTNKEAFKFNERRDTCVLTSYALHSVLQQIGFSSSLLRVEAGIFPDDRRCCGTILGSGPLNRNASKPGMWKGHLVVVVGDQWLLDATLDQANKDEWPNTARVGPIVVELTSRF
jgi:hypothetical protein